MSDPIATGARPGPRAYSSVGKGMTERFEGYRRVAYQDAAGVWTIAFGHTAGVFEGMTCTIQQAEAWLDEDIAWAGEVVNAHVTVPLTQGEFDSLVDFTFNLGAGSFEGSTLFRLLEAGDFAAAAAEFPKWDHVAGKESAGLLSRRLAEQAEFNGSPIPNT